MKPRSRIILKVAVCLLIVVTLDAVCVKAASGRARAHIPESPLTFRARTARISDNWNGPLNAYTGGSYGVSLANQLWPSAPHGLRRQIVLGAAVHHHVPFRLLLGIWGAESSFGKAACNFGLTGNYPGRGTSGNFRKDAHMAADILDRLYRSRYGRRAL